MRKENGIILFENNEEQRETINDDSFKGIVISKRACVILSCNVVWKKGKIIRDLGNISTTLLYSGNVGKELENKVRELFSKDSIGSKMKDIPEIFISNDLKGIFNA